MASPHVAGAAALLLAANPAMPPAQVKAALLAGRQQVAMPGDPDGINEGVLNIGPAPTVAPPAPSSSPEKRKNRKSRKNKKKKGRR
jgi:subtilisin family serine protease